MFSWLWYVNALMKSSQVWQVVTQCALELNRTAIFLSLLVKCLTERVRTAQITDALIDEDYNVTISVPVEACCKSFLQTTVGCFFDIQHINQNIYWRKYQCKWGRKRRQITIQYANMTMKWSIIRIWMVNTSLFVSFKDKKMDFKS